MIEMDSAFLVLRAPALLPKNQAERERLLADIARQLDVEGEVDLATITNVGAEGTDTAARFPVSQEAICELARGPLWNSRMAELFLAPNPS
jgi:hypothetical protein